MSQSKNVYLVTNLATASNTAFDVLGEAIAAYTSVPGAATLAQQTWVLSATQTITTKEAPAAVKVAAPGPTAIELALSKAKAKAKEENDRIKSLDTQADAIRTAAEQAVASLYGRGQVPTAQPQTEPQEALAPVYRTPPAAAKFARRQDLLCRGVHQLGEGSVTTIFVERTGSRWAIYTKIGELRGTKAFFKSEADARKAWAEAKAGKDARLSPGRVRGNSKARTHLTPAQIHTICKMIASGSFEAGQIASEFDITPSTVSLIYLGKSHQDVSRNYDFSKFKKVGLKEKLARAAAAQKAYFANRQAN